MRDKLNVFYYPEFWIDYPTLIKSILLFDELHFMDRPSMAFDNFVTIGAQSPLRSVEENFREQGVPFYVHTAPGGPVRGEWLKQIAADVNDPLFLRGFQDGLKTSPTFRHLQVQPKANYGEYGDGEAVAARLMAVNLDAELVNHENAMALFGDTSVHPFDLSRPIGCAKNLITAALTCSAKLNFALQFGSKEGFVPLADARPYGDLLGSKYARATSALSSSNKVIQITDLSFAIFDQVLSSERLRAITVPEAISYRKQCAGAREAFLEHLDILQAKQSNIEADGDYSAAVDKIITTEILPAARSFQNKLKSIDEALFGAVTKGLITAAGGTSLIQLFGDLSWPKLIAAAGAGAAYAASALVDSIMATRAAKREFSISYILSLDD